MNRHVLEHRDSVNNAGDQLANQRITTKSAEANYLNSKLTREVAEIVVREYVEGILVQDEARRKLRSGLLRATWDGPATRSRSSGDEKTSTGLASMRSVPAWIWKRPRARKKTLVEYTKSRSIKDLEADVAKARVDELVKKETWEIEKNERGAIREVGCGRARAAAVVEHRGLDLLRRATSDRGASSSPNSASS